MNKIIKGLLVALLVLGGFYIVAQQGEPVGKVDQLPWMINTDDPSATQVFGVRVGGNTLAEVSTAFKKLPELAIFQKNLENRVLEAYFPKVRLGVLRANIIAVLDIDHKSLSSYADFRRPGKPMPSGSRKYMLSLSGLKESGALTVWKLTYMPIISYSEEQLLKFFGEPAKKTVISSTSQYWHYPQNALLIAYDTEGKEVFHYTSKEQYKRLLNELLEVVNDK